MSGGIIALWQVHGDSYQSLLSEAYSDAQMFGVDPSADDYDLITMKCTPTKIEGGRVEQWRGWAIITYRSVDLSLTLQAIHHEETQLLNQHNR